MSLLLSLELPSSTCLQNACLLGLLVTRLGLPPLHALHNNSVSVLHREYDGRTSSSLAYEARAHKQTMAGHHTLQWNILRPELTSSWIPAAPARRPTNPSALHVARNSAGDMAPMMRSTSSLRSTSHATWNLARFAHCLVYSPPSLIPRAPAHPHPTLPWFSRPPWPMHYFRRLTHLPCSAQPLRGAVEQAPPHLTPCFPGRPHSVALHWPHSERFTRSAVREESDSGAHRMWKVDGKMIFQRKPAMICGTQCGRTELPA
mmetsp:Transcript_75032/g.242702  ORF Transcript_75032/g.242702 Transcript_75032/m.242702 type:complete len:260 (+) Transcript_75032:689-1468(+)